MAINRENGQAKMAVWGWGILLGLSALLTLAGIGWLQSIPQMALDNIAEYASLEPAAFMKGRPSAFNVISVITRGSGAGYVALGLIALLVALEGYRNSTRWAWMAMWVLVLAYAAIATIFLLAEEIYALSIGIQAFAAITGFGLLLARKSLAG